MFSRLKITAAALLLTAVLSASDIGDFYFDGRLHQAGGAVNERPVFTAEVSSGNGALGLADFHLLVDGVDILTAGSYTYDNVVFRYVFTTPLSGGQHDITLDIGHELKTVLVNVLSGRGLSGELIIFPSPATENLNVFYELQNNQEVSFLIYDLNGQLVLRQDFASGQIGGQAGGNQFKLDLTMQSRRPLSNGVYIAVLLQRNGSRAVLGKEKFIILR
jgi:hypothetical protein